MKCLAWIVVTFFSLLTAQAQDLHGFKIENGKLIWQKVYRSDKSMDDLANYFNRSIAIQNLKVSGELLTGRLSKTEIYYKGAGFSWTSTPDYVLFYDVSAFFTIDFKEGRYRITIDQIYITQKKRDPNTGRIEVTLLSTHVLKKNKYRSNFIKAGAEIFDFTFSKYFEVRAGDDDKEW